MGVLNNEELLRLGRGGGGGYDSLMEELRCKGEVPLVFSPWNWSSVV